MISLTSALAFHDLTDRIPPAVLVANQEQSLDAVKLARGLAGFRLPPEVALMPGDPFYRAEDHQLIPSLYLGVARSTGAEPEDLFKVLDVVKGSDFAPPPAETRRPGDGPRPSCVECRPAASR